MPTSQENIDFINKAKFFKESNITNIFITNLFNISFNFSNSDKDVVDNRLLLDILLRDKSVNFNNLEFNVASIRMPSVNNTYDTMYFNNNRYYTNYRDDSDILTLAFFENSSLDIRRFFRTWIDLTRIDQKNVYNPDNGLPYTLYPSQYDCKELRMYPISGKYESNSFELYNRIHPISITDITPDLTQDAELPIVSVNFVYKSYKTRCI